MTTNRNSRYRKILFMISTFSLLSISVNAQVSLTATAGTLAQSYTTLGAAFTAINAGTHQGVITINLTGNTSEAATATLNASGSGSASYTSITVKPTGGAARSISGSIAGPLINLNGADNVTIDGLNTGSNSLAISNTNTGNSTTCTIRFIGDASSNTVTNCTVTGSSTATTLGTIFFSTGTTTGNDNNTVSSCTIAEAGANLPAIAIYCSGTATAGIENSNIMIFNNNIANYFSATMLNSAGIQVAAGATGWTIETNKFYQTTTRTLSASSLHNAISFKTGSGHTISGNTIGYASSTGTGTYTIDGTGLNCQFYPIQLAVGTTSVTSVHSNTITAIDFKTINSTFSGGGPFSCIYVSSGDVNIGGGGGNFLGTMTGTGAITLSTGGSAPASGIALTTTGTVMIQNNTIGGFTVANAAAATGAGLAGIYVNGVVTSLTITANNIGNFTANNMVAGTSGFTTAGTNAAGISHNVTPTAETVTNNIIQNFASYGSGNSYARGMWTLAAAASSSVFIVRNNTVKNILCAGTNTTNNHGQTGLLGIHVAVGTNDTISGNTVFNLQATNTGTGAYFAAGISLGAATNTAVFNNTVYGISNAGTGTTATAPPQIAGILIASGTTAVTVFNNMVSLGNGQATNTAITGIHCAHNSSPNPTDNIYHNTVNIEGTVSSGALPSFCMHRGDFSSNTRTMTVDVRNNIFTNSRTGGSGKHYAIGNNLNATSNNTGWGSNASDYNVLNANAATIGYWGSDRTFANWQSNASGDANSFSGLTVTYVNTANDLHLNMGTTATDIESGGATIATVTTDLDGQVRPGPAGSVNNGALAPDLGADEFDGVPNIISWSGATNNNWSTNTNWVGNAVPATSATARIPAGLTNYPIITTGTVTIRSIIINSGGSLTLSGGTLQVSRSITNNGTFDGMAGGTVEFNGTAPQTIPWNTFYANTLANLKINNSAGVTLGTTFYITGTLTPTSGVFNTNNALWLQSSALGTARIAAGSTGGGYINGDVTIQRLIPGKRAFRFLAHPFSSAIALTELTDDIDITGSGGSANGFTNTTTNSPSSFWYDVSAGDNSTTGTNPGWTAFTSTNGAGANAWNPYTGARILVRGGLGEGLSGGAYTPSSVGIDMTGPVNQGNITVTLTKGSNTNYVFVGNPFPSQVNMDAVSGTNTGSAFYIWDATQGTKGGYTSYSFGSSSFNLPSCAGFVTTISANGSMLFEEADKTGNTPGTMFKTTGAANTVQLRMEDSTMFWDRLLLHFDGNAMATVDYPDAAKLYNPDISFYTFSKDDSMLSIDARPYTDGETIKLGLYSTLQKNFKIVASEFDMPAGTKLFLHDKFLNKTEEITGAGYEYWFAVTADPASTGNGRFELNTQGQETNGIVAVNEKHAVVALMPNPAKDNVIVHYEGMDNGNIMVTVKDIKGATVKQMQQASANNGSIQLSLNGLAAGVYMVTLQNGNQAIVQKLVKE